VFCKLLSQGLVSGVVLTPKLVFDVCGRAGSLTSADAASFFPTLRLLSMMAVANEADFFRSNLV